MKWNICELGGNKFFLFGITLVLLWQAVATVVAGEICYRVVAIEDPSGTNGLNTNMDSSTASDISDSGLITGRAYTALDSLWQGYPAVMVYSISNRSLAIDTFPGQAAYAFGINASGQVSLSADYLYQLIKQLICSRRYPFRRVLQEYPQFTYLNIQ